MSICEHCGKVSSDSANYCEACGHKLTKKKSEKGREYVAVEIITSDLPF